MNKGKNGKYNVENPENDVNIGKEISYEFKKNIQDKFKKSIYKDIELENNELYNKQLENIEKISLSIANNENFKKLIRSINETTESIINNENLKKQIEFALNLSEKINKTLYYIFNKIDFTKISDYFINLLTLIEDIKKDPKSIYNYYKYEEKLKNFFWPFPLYISEVELFRILTEVKDEVEFDNFMDKIYTDDKVNNLIEDISKNIDINHRNLVYQIKNGFTNKLYALINTSIIPLIDYELAFFTQNICKDRNRLDIYKPIILDLVEKNHNEIELLQLIMLNNSINILFQRINFNNIEKNIKTNKKIRRHTNQHGFDNSNNRVESIMLLNILLQILYFQRTLNYYEKKLNYIKEEKKYIIN